MKENMAKKLTELGVGKLVAMAKAYTRVVDGNLYIKVHPCRVKVWQYRNIQPGTTKRRWVSLGKMNAFNDREKAKEQTREYNKQIDEGLNLYAEQLAGQQWPEPAGLIDRADAAKAE